MPAGRKAELVARVMDKTTIPLVEDSHKNRLPPQIRALPIRQPRRINLLRSGRFRQRRVYDGGTIMSCAEILCVRPYVESIAGGEPLRRARVCERRALKALTQWVISVAEINSAYGPESASLVECRTPSTPGGTKLSIPPMYVVLSTFWTRTAQVLETKDTNS